MCFKVNISEVKDASNGYIGGWFYGRSIFLGRDLVLHGKEPSC